jgi:hypothetical protein
VTRRPTGPQAAAVLASLSVNAILFLGLRQVAGPASAPAADEIVPLLVIETGARDPRPRSRPERHAPGRAKAPRRPRSPRYRDAAAASATTAGTGAAPARSTSVVEVAADAWRMPGREPGHPTFPTAFQRSLADPAPDIERPHVLAGVAFHDGSFAGLLARLAKLSDCGELEAARARHPESAATIARTMEELHCGS